MIYEWSNGEQREEIERALRPPASWRDPLTGLPAGWGDEEDDWAEWQSQMGE